MDSIVIFGNNIISEMLYVDIKACDVQFEVAAFVVDEQYLNSKEFCGLPLVGYHEALSKYSPSKYGMILTVYSSKRLRSRMELFYRIKEAGYYMPNYISPFSDVAPDLVAGESNIIMAMSHIGLHGIMGNCNLIRQNVYIGHDFSLGDGNIFAAGCILGGSCQVGDSCFIGLGATIVDRTIVANETLIGAGATVIKDTEAHTTYVGNPAKSIGTHIENGISMR